VVNIKTLLLFSVQPFDNDHNKFFLSSVLMLIEFKSFLKYVTQQLLFIQNVWAISQLNRFLRSSFLMLIEFYSSLKLLCLLSSCWPLIGIYKVFF